MILLDIVCYVFKVFLIFFSQLYSNRKVKIIYCLTKQHESNLIKRIRKERMKHIDSINKDGN